MASTKTYVETLQDAVNNGNPTDLANALKAMALGTMLSPVKMVVTGMTAASAVDITNPTTFTGATVTLTGLPSSTTAESPVYPNAVTEAPPILTVRTLRVTASGTGASVGAYGVTDAGGTAIVPPGGASAALGIALLSDDGKTLTFPNTITAFILEYMPRSAQALSSNFGS